MLGFHPSQTNFNLFSDIDYFVSTLNSSFYKTNKDNIIVFGHLVDSCGDPVFPSLEPPPPGATVNIISIESCTFDEEVLNNGGYFNLILSYNQGSTASFQNIIIKNDTVTEI